MFLLLDNEVDITNLRIGNLVCHITEGDALIVLHTLFNVDLHDLPLGLGLSLATMAVAVLTGLLNLLNHPRSDLTHFHPSALSVTLGTLADVPNNYLSINGKFNRLALVQVLKTNLKRVVDAWALSRSSRARSPTTAPEEHGEQILSVHITRMAVIADTLQAVLIVSLALVFVGQNLVGCIDFLKLVFIASLVWVVDATEAPVGLLDIFLIGVL
mmetsp:Transcript_14522/g.31465  ORF Transcript_14522/g.31465 Transcript_14522/m.31465 type:complete len:214 (-) Transcript_14522:251-892(-)